MPLSKPIAVGQDVSTSARDVCNLPQVYTGCWMRIPCTYVSQWGPTTNIHYLVKSIIKGKHDFRGRLQCVQLRLSYAPFPKATLRGRGAIGRRRRGRRGVWITPMLTLVIDRPSLCWEHHDGILPRQRLTC